MERGGSPVTSNRKNAKTPLEDHLPAHDNIFFPGPFEKQVPERVQKSRCEQEQEGRNGHAVSECITKIMSSGGF